MSKKNNLQYKKTQGGGGFSKGKGNNEADFLYREDADDTHFMSFTFEDFPNFERDNEDDPELLFILKRICASYKHVLTLEFRNFWSTLKHNQLLRRSLNTFLQYATKRKFNEYYRRGHEREEVEMSESENKIILKEITRLVLTIFYRILSCQEENLNKSNEFSCHKIILDEWLIDIPKMLDIIVIYGSKNEKIVKDIIRKSFEMQKEFQTDFDEMQDKILKEYLDGYYKELLLLKKKDKLGSSSCDIADSDIERKVELLCSILDTSSSILDILHFFPAEEVERLYLDEKINIMLENISYELIFAREEAWVMGKYRGDIILLIDVVLDKIVNFFVDFFTKMIKVFGDKNLIKQNVGKKMVSMWNKYIKDLGKIQSFGKKQGDNRYWYLIEYTGDKLDFSRLFEVAPADISETYQLFQIQVMSVIDERKRNIIAYEEKKKEYELKGDDEKQQQIVSEEIPDIKFDESIAKEDIIKLEEKQRKAEEFQKKKEEDDRQRQEQEDKEQEQRRLEEKQEKLTVYQKGVQKVNLKMSQEEEKQYIQKSLWLAMEYDDEPDDSYNHFQPIVSGGGTANNDVGQGEEGDTDDDEHDESGHKKSNKQTEEGYDDGKNRRNYDGYKPKQNNPNKSNHYEAKLKYKSNNRVQDRDHQSNQTNNSQSISQPNNINNNNYNNNNNNNNNYGNNQQPKKQYYDNNNQNAQRPVFKKKQNRNEEGFSGSEDDNKPRNKEGNFKETSLPFYNKNKKEAPAQKNILKKKQFGN